MGNAFGAVVMIVIAALLAPVFGFCLLDPRRVARLVGLPLNTPSRFMNYYSEVTFRLFGLMGFGMSCFVIFQITVGLTRVLQGCR
jgi:hypothetical protein